MFFVNTAVADIFHLQRCPSVHRACVFPRGLEFKIQSVQQSRQEVGWFEKNSMPQAQG